MSADMAFELKRIDFFEKGESSECPGKTVVALASDDRRMEKSGLALITADLGDDGFRDTDVINAGRDPPSMRSVSFLLNYNGYKQAAQWVPAWAKVPGWLLWASASRL
ncbi:unnamed protein product [Cylicostephanus goldi]|uniref:Uncharacterized protein n=1 Tax=Cylicostephanus goldi TaxID=71465 RepID=A0A3P6SGE6_CYLGO|nr:unnamed protein product [Cylicostephanus goldi]